MARTSICPRRVEQTDVSAAAVVLKLVPGGLGHGGLAAVRTLGRMNVDMYGVTVRRNYRSVRSRFEHSHPTFVRDDCDAHILADLLEVSQRFDQPVLIPADDVAALFVDAHAHQLENGFRFPIRPAALADRLSNKRKLHHLCTEVGVPTPAAWYPRSRSELETFAASASFPLVLKSMDPRLLRQRREASSVVLVQDGKQLLETYDLMEVPEKPNLMVQEYVPGGPETVWIFNGYFDANGDCLVGFTGRKVRQYLPDTGAASVGICGANPEVDAATRTLMKKVGYAGIVDMGWRLDPRDGKYKLLDVNPRMGATFRLVVGTNGMDVVRAQYLDLTGQHVPVTRAVDGRRWINEADDLASTRILRPQGRASYRGWMTETLRSDERAWFAVDDMGPFMSTAWLLIVTNLSRRYRSRVSQR